MPSHGYSIPRRFISRFAGRIPPAYVPSAMGDCSITARRRSMEDDSTGNFLGIADVFFSSASVSCFKARLFGI